MRLYNSYTLQVEEFKPVVQGQVSMYVCGPTVYNHAHIGNARPVVVFDTLRRVFEAFNYKVKYVSNFTDVDDKIINRAIEEGTDEKTVAETYIAAYNQVREMLNTEPLDATPRVTETMDEMIAFIAKLVEAGAAYEVNGDVYFSVNADRRYGELSHQDPEDLMSGARVEENAQKQNPLDFALWKKTDTGVQWDSPWGKGRPGWHTECVVMIGKEFDHSLIDIHGGGKDLKFPHHENEMAQSQIVNHHRLANYWVHNGMLAFDGEKMSKSLGNVRLAKDVIRQLGANLTRYFLLSVRYRDVLNFTDEAIETSRKELDRITGVLRQVELKAGLGQISLNNSYNVDRYNEFLENMADDLNTPNAYMVMFDVVKQLNQALRTRNIDDDVVSRDYNCLRMMLDILGIAIEPLVLSEEAIALYNKWMEAKSDHDFETADAIRAQLQQNGIL